MSQSTSRDGASPKQVGVASLLTLVPLKEGGCAVNGVASCIVHRTSNSSIGPMA
jgi:hypothetical protein